MARAVAGPSARRHYARAALIDLVGCSREVGGPVAAYDVDDTLDADAREALEPGVVSPHCRARMRDVSQ